MMATNKATRRLATPVFLSDLVYEYQAGDAETNVSPQAGGFTAQFVSLPEDSVIVVLSSRTVTKVLHNCCT